MVGAVVAGVITGLVELIIQKLELPSFEEVGRFFGVKGKLEGLEKTLSTIKAVLGDAEEEHSTDNSAKIWLLNLKDVACDIEDLLDLISTRQLECKVNGASFSHKIMQLSWLYNLSQELKAITRRLDDIAEDRRNYSFQKRQRLDISSIIETNCGRETCSYIQELHIFGREQDTEWIVSCLFGSSCCEAKELPVIPIIGIGGIGKTTLAKLVFNDAKVAENCELKLWAYVSKNFVLKTVIVNIIQSAIGQTFSHFNMQALLNILNDILAGRSFLLVLDDVWVEDLKQWLELKDLLSIGSVMLINPKFKLL